MAPGAAGPPTPEAIIVETERTFMRALTPDDVEPLHRVLGDLQAMWWLSAPWPISETESWIRSAIEAQRRDGCSLWALISKASGDLIGDCGLLHRDATGRPEYELGYHLRRDHWNQGIATEAAAAVRDYARNTIGAPRLVAITLPANMRSRRVMERIGMTFERVFEQISRDGVPEPRVLYSTEFSTTPA